jgi:hypothetical protein
MSARGLKRRLLSFWRGTAPFPHVWVKIGPIRSSAGVRRLAL